MSDARSYCKINKPPTTPWDINWYVCTADANDVKHAKSQGKEMEVGHEFWRVPQSIGPISVDHNHWAGHHLDVTEEQARLIAAVPVMLAALKDICGNGDGTGRNPQLMVDAARDAIRKAEGNE